MNKVHNIGERLRAEDGASFRWSDAIDILQFLGFPVDKEFPMAIKEINSGFFRSDLWPDSEKDFSLPNVLISALNPDPGKRSPFTPDDVIADSIEYMRIWKTKDNELLISLFRILDNANLEWEDQKKIIENMTDVFYQARIPRYKYLIEGLGSYMKKKIEEARKDGGLIAQAELARKQNRIEELEEENKKLRSEIDEIRFSAWDIAVNAGLLEKNNINGTYKTLIGGVQMTLESWMREIREYNRTGKKQLDIPNVGEIHKLLRKKNGMKYSEKSIANWMSHIN